MTTKRLDIDLGEHRAYTIEYRVPPYSDAPTGSPSIGYVSIYLKTHSVTSGSIKAPMLSLLRKITLPSAKTGRVAANFGISASPAPRLMQVFQEGDEPISP